jgi:hypothetical protein
MHWCLGARRSDGTFSPDGCSMRCKFTALELLGDRRLCDKTDDSLCNRCQHPISFHLEERISVPATQQGERLSFFDLIHCLL